FHGCRQALDGTLGFGVGTNPFNRRHCCPKRPGEGRSGPKLLRSRCNPISLLLHDPPVFCRRSRPLFQLVVSGDSLFLCDDVRAGRRPLLAPSRMAQEPHRARSAAVCRPYFFYQFVVDFPFLTVTLPLVSVKLEDYSKGNPAMPGGPVEK